MARTKTYINWSSGKDAALALYHLKKDKTLDIDRLVTTLNSHHQRVSMHGLKRELLEKQAQSIGLPLETIELPEEPTMEDYNHIMEHTVKNLQKAGYTTCGFGDIFLQDLRIYREEQLKPYRISCLFPLWKKDTKELIRQFIELGFKAIVVCINADLLDASFLGREIDKDFLNDLPSEVDPCGENGEFHTFCFDGPILSGPVPFTLGERIYREYKAPKQNDNQHTNRNTGFWFVDLLPVD